MVRKKLDERIRTLINRSVASNQRSLLILVGDYGKDQVPNLYQILTKASIKSRPKVLWCYKKQLGFSTHRQKRMKRLKRDKARGLLKDSSSNAESGSSATTAAENFELFISGTDINWCYYRDTHRVLGTTHGVLVLQDFEALTPNILARTIETVEGGGLVIFLLRTVKSLRQLYTMTMDVHARYRTDGGGDIVPRFNERFILSLASCRNCLVCDDELNILPLSKSALASLSDKNESVQIMEHADETGEVFVSKTKAERELDDLKATLNDTPHVGAVVDLAKTLDQARAVLVFMEACSEKTGKSTIALTAARGRGKSAAIGLCLAGAMSLGYSTVAVTAPEPENLVAVFDFILRGLKELKYQEHMDYKVTYNNAYGREATKCVIGIDIYRDHRQSIKYIRPDEPDKFASAEIVAIDEAAAIPLPAVRKLIGDRLTFISSTVNGYEGTGRALSLKLIKELRDTKGKNVLRSATADANVEIPGTDKLKDGQKVHERKWAAAAAAAEAGSVGQSSLVEIDLSKPIRYAQGDEVEDWLNLLLCLDCGSGSSSKLRGGIPAPNRCELYSVDRDALFSYHKLSEGFLQKLMGLYTSAHYKNSPNDLQMLSDAPAHSVFVLLSSAAEEESDSLPDILAVVQVALEGNISRKVVEAQLARGHRSAGDLIPWTISQQFCDSNFARLSGARIVRVAVHPVLQGMGYGSRAIEMLYRYYNGEMVDLAAGGEVESDAEDCTSESADEDNVQNEIGVGLKGERLKPRIQLPPLLLPLTEVKAPRLDWIGTSFGLTRDLLKFWKRSGMRTVYLRQTKNELTGEFSAILVRALSGRTGYDDAWLAAFASDSKRRLLSLLSGSFRDLDVKLAISLVDNDAGNTIKGLPDNVNDGNNQEVLSEMKERSGLQSQRISASELNIFLTPHDLKRLELYGRNLCDHHLVTDLLPVVAQLYFTRRIGETFLVSDLQAGLLCGLGLQHKTIDDLSRELVLPTNQVLAMFNKAIRKLSIAFTAVIEENERKVLLNEELRRTMERKVENLKNVTETTLQEDTEEAGKEAMKFLENQQSCPLPREIKNNHEVRQYILKGSEAEWIAAVKSMEVKGSRTVQIQSKMVMEKRKLNAEDIEKEAKLTLNEDRKSKGRSFRKTKKRQ